MPHRPARARAAVALLATAALTTTLLAAYAVSPAGADVPGGKAPAASRTEGRAEGRAASRAASRAMAAVTEARAVSQDGKRGDLTMALRDVANSRDSLRGADRAAADDLLARPTASGGGDGTLDYGNVPEQTPVCSPDICVHYVTSGVNAVDPTDLTPLNGTPDYVDLALRTLTVVHDAYITAGYREPKADGTRGGNSKIDVYLGELGSRGLYGYCTSDDPTRSTKFWDRWAYCALDNDYAEFPTNTPVENLQVTVAHEYFHATQFAYDRYEDAWLLEATATWVEDEMYDDVNDNLQYLRTSPITQPRTSLDTFGNGFHYGTWSYVRLLTEKFPAKKGRLPRLVLDIWRKADGSLGKPDQYSWQAVNNVLATKRTTGAATLGTFAVANRRPARAYDEGRVNHYPTAPLAGRHVVTQRRGVRKSFRLNHLSTSTSRLTPQGLNGPRWKLRLTFDLPPLGRGSSALVTSASKAGKVATRRIRLGRQGDGVARIPFSSGKVGWVEVTIVNGSGRFQCFVEGGNYSCAGKPLDNRQLMRFTAFAVR